MRSLLEHLDTINELLPTLHDGFFVESYDFGKEQIVIVGTRDVSYYRDLVIRCTSPIEVRFFPSFDVDTIRLTKHESGHSVLEFIDEGSVRLFIRGGFLEYECEHT